MESALVEEVANYLTAKYNQYKNSFSVETVISWNKLELDEGVVTAAAAVLLSAPSRMASTTKLRPPNPHLRKVWKYAEDNGGSPTTKPASSPLINIVIAQPSPLH